MLLVPVTSIGKEGYPREDPFFSMRGTYLFDISYRQLSHYVPLKIEHEYDYFRVYCEELCTAVYLYTVGRRRNEVITDGPSLTSAVLAARIGVAGRAGGGR